jgi:hypothetical protein
MGLPNGGRYRQVVAIRRWSFTQVQFQIFFYFFQVRWGDKKDGYGEHYWEYNHGPSEYKAPAPVYKPVEYKTAEYKPAEYKPSEPAAVYIPTYNSN